jgi:hypothetical protein
MTSVARLVPVKNTAVRRWKLLATLAGLVVVFAAGAIAWPAPKSTISIEQFDQIQEGMTLQEVEALLGPRGDFRTGPTVAIEEISSIWGLGGCPPGMGPTALSGGYWRFKWEADWAEVVVLVKPPDDLEPWALAPGEKPVGRTISAHFCDMTLEHGALYNAVWRIKRLWHRWFP